LSTNLNKAGRQLINLAEPGTYLAGGFIIPILKMYLQKLDHYN